MRSRYSVLSLLSVFGVGFVLAITVFLANQPQDIRQQASTTIDTPTPILEIAGCPPQNPDGRKNVCRSESACPAGELEKVSGKEECTQKMNKPSLCCTIISPR